MHVNEAWGHHPTISLNDPTSLCLVKLADGGNSLTTNANISVVPWTPGAIYNTTSSDDEIKHFLPPIYFSQPLQLQILRPIIHNL